MRILVAEDSEVSRVILVKMLEKGGHEVIATVNGDEAWTELQKTNPPRLAILDLMMPEMDGLEVCRRVRQSENHSYTYIVMQTAKGTPADIEAGFNTGVDDYLVKPINGAELLHRVRVAERILAYEQEQQDSRDKLDRFAKKMQALAEERAKQLLHADRMATLGTLSAGIAHEINNPATFIAGNAQTMKRAWDLVCDHIGDNPSQPPKNAQLEIILDEFPKMVAGVQKGVERITKIVSGLKRFAHQEVKEKKPFNPTKAIEESLELCHNRLKHEIQVDTSLPDSSLEILGDKQQIEQVLINLITNAADAVLEKCKGKGKLNITLTTAGAMACLTVSDNGSGLKPDVLDRVFNPFFTTKKEGKGTGLGLSISKGIIEEHGGKMTGRNLPDGGAEFSFTLPLNGIENEADGKKESHEGKTINC